jgi:hypothetical protein
MKYLSQGLESKKKVVLLLSLTKITSENITMALHDHLVMNFGVKDAAIINGCRQSNVAAALVVLNEVAKVVELINELKYICASSSK